jgi:2-polyprenyl-3-methyl-5-hydroxy-6-metoxy-1,4-benzoquinol methylase
VRRSRIPTKRSDLDPDYGRHYRELYEKHWWWRAREEILVDELRRRVPKGASLAILDVGCGDALFFSRLCEFGEVEGIESVPELVDPNGPNRARITVAPFDASFQPRKNYDLILMLDVLEHFDAPEQALRRAVDLLKPAGIVVVTVPAFLILWTDHDLLNRHRTRFTKRSFARLASASRMEIMTSRYFFVWLALAKLALRMAEAILPTHPRIPGIPAHGINEFMYRISRTEEKLTRLLHVPVGSSLLVVGRRIPESI